MTDEITILAGAKACPLTRRDAAWLVDRLRETYVGEESEEATAAQQLAWALELTLQDALRRLRGDKPRP